MANGQEEQLTGEQLTEEPLSQVAAQTTTIGQALGSMNEFQKLEFKHLLKVKQYKKEITSNVGDRAAYYIDEVTNKRMTWKQAVDKSKEALTPTMLDLNNSRFQDDMTALKYRRLQLDTGLNWSKEEFNLWYKNYTAIASKERIDLVNKGQISRREANNQDYSEKARVYYMDLEDFVDNALSGTYNFETGGRTPIEVDEKQNKIIQSAWSAIMAEIQKDLGYDENMNFNQDLYNTGDQNEIYDQLFILVNNFPASYFDRQRILQVGDESIPVYGEDWDVPTKQKVLYDLLKKQVVKAKLQLANIQDPTIPEPEEVDPYEMYLVD